MKINLEMTMAAVALFAVAYHLGKRRAVAERPAGAVTAASPADWWTFAGAWGG